LKLVEGEEKASEKKLKNKKVNRDPTLATMFLHKKTLHNNKKKIGVYGYQEKEKT